jgi:hypothetical protein
MKIKVYVVDFELAPVVRRWWWRLGAGVVALCGITAIAYAVTLPKTFKDGDTLSAADLNASFRAVSVLTYNGSSYSVGATKFCGATTTHYTGNLGGYAGAKQACETACASPTSHMCMPEEMVRSAAVGVPMQGVNGWVSTGVLVTEGTDQLTYVGDCGTSYGSNAPAWTRTNAATQGRVAGANWADGAFSYDLCTSSYSILCCD